LADLHNKCTCDSDADDNKNDVSGGIFEVQCVWWKNNGYKLLIYLGLRKTVGFKMFDKYIVIRHAWYAFSSFEIQLLSFFQGSLIFGESDVKMHFCSTYGAHENLYEFTVWTNLG
jgi:hypothetical protein